MRRAKTQERVERQSRRRQDHTDHGVDGFTIEDAIGEDNVIMDPEETQILPDDQVILNTRFLSLLPAEIPALQCQKSTPSLLSIQQASYQSLVADT
jgi:hypothetical protein